MNRPIIYIDEYIIYTILVRNHVWSPTNPKYYTILVRNHVWCPTGTCTPNGRGTPNGQNDKSMNNTATDGPDKKYVPKPKYGSKIGVKKTKNMT